MPIWYSLATAHIADGEDSRAEVLLSDILDAGALRVEYPIQWVRSHYLLAQIHERRGESSRAAELYRRFYELWRDGEIDRDRVEEARRKSGL